MFCPDDGAEIREHTHGHGHAYAHTYTHAYAHTFSNFHNAAEYKCPTCGTRWVHDFAARTY